MSDEFYQFPFPCKDCVVAAICKEKPSNAKSIILEYNDPVLCLTIPEVPNKDIKTYHKTLLECWANMGRNLIDHVQKQTSVNHKTELNNNLPRDYLYLMSRMADLLQWLVNSKSWEVGESQEFDISEIEKKLKFLVV
jgi:hypothetical protein